MISFPWEHVFESHLRRGLLATSFSRSVAGLDVCVVMGRVDGEATTCGGEVAFLGVDDLHLHLGCTAEVFPGRRHVVTEWSGPPLVSHGPSLE